MWTSMQKYTENDFEERRGSLKPCASLILCHRFSEPLGFLLVLGFLKPYSGRILYHRFLECPGFLPFPFFRTLGILTRRTHIGLNLPNEERSEVFGFSNTCIRFFARALAGLWFCYRMGASCYENLHRSHVHKKEECSVVLGLFEDHLSDPY